MLTYLKVVRNLSPRLELLLAAVLEKHCEVVMEGLQNRNVKDIFRDLSELDGVD